MTYEFIAEDGTVIEENHPMKTVPDEIKRDGKTYNRVAFSRSNKHFFNDGQVDATVNGYPHQEYSFPKGEDLGGGLAPNGRPIVKSQAHEREIMARYNMRRD